jgi:hypothetical protein
MSCGVCAIIPLTRLFTAEYAGQFDVFLPGLAALGQPLLAALIHPLFLAGLI